jgi:hypothetical protein
MVRYQKKQLQVQAVQWFKDGDHPDVRRCDQATCLRLSNLSPSLDAVNWTQMGVCGEAGRERLVKPGYYVVTGITGEIYPVSPDIFKESYELFNENTEKISSPLELRHFVSHNWADGHGNPAGGSVHGIGFVIVWQNGPLKEQADSEGAVAISHNGASVEQIIAACADRLEFFQDSKFSSQYNEDAIAHLDLAIACLKARTEDREKRGVEGTNQI